jgi:hypothetical protein
MTSLLKSTRTVGTDGGYYIPVADCRNTLYSYDGVGAISSASWARWPVSSATSSGGYSSLVNAAGAGILKDMGKTVVSSNRTFRKVQLVVNSPSTFGVAGVVGTTYPQQDFLTAYIELGFEGSGSFTPVAKFGR